MRPKTLALLAVAVMCGLVAMMGVQQVLSNQNDGKTEVGKVLVAKAEILPGQPLDANNVEFKEWPAGSIPEGAIVKKEQIEDRTLKVRAFPGDLILEVKLDKKGNRSASSEVKEGMCLTSVAIDPNKTGIGLIHPNDRVDVLVTYRSAGNRDANTGVGQEVKTVVESVEVFAIDGVRDPTLIPRAGDPKAIPMKTVQLMVTNEQARLLNLAGDVGKIHLTLRGMNDGSHVDIKDLFDPSKAEHALARDTDDPVEREVAPPVVVATPPAPPVQELKTNKKWKIEIIAGNERKIEEVDLFEAEPSTLSPSQGS